MFYIIITGKLFLINENFMKDIYKQSMKYIFLPQRAIYLSYLVFSENL